MRVLTRNQSGVSLCQPKSPTTSTSTADPSANLLVRLADDGAEAKVEDVCCCVVAHDGTAVLRNQTSRLQIETNNLIDSACNNVADADGAKLW